MYKLFGKTCLTVSRRRTQNEENEYACGGLLNEKTSASVLSTGTEITVVADAASVGSDAGSIHHEATLILVRQSLAHR